jgi:hypothetical protein
MNDAEANELVAKCANVVKKKVATMEAAALGVHDGDMLSAFLAKSSKEPQQRQQTGSPRTIAFIRCDSRLDNLSQDQRSRTLECAEGRSALFPSNALGSFTVSEPEWDKLAAENQVKLDALHRDEPASRHAHSAKMSASSNTGAEIEESPLESTRVSDPDMFDPQTGNAIKPQGPRKISR